MIYMFGKYLFWSKRPNNNVFSSPFLSAVLCAKNLVKKDFFRKYPTFINTENVFLKSSELRERSIPVSISQRSVLAEAHLLKVCRER